MRIRRLELLSSAWKADNLPLIYTRKIKIFKAKKGIEPLLLDLQSNALPFMLFSQYILQNKHIEI